MKRALSIFISVIVMFFAIFSNTSVLAANVKPKMPEISNVYNTTSGIRVKWNGVKNADSYRVYKRKLNQKWEYVRTVKSTSFFDKNVNNGTSYRYTVRAVDNDVYSDFEQSQIIRRLVIPYDLEATNSIDGVLVKWKRVAGATSYRLYRKAPNQKSWRHIATPRTNSYTDKNVVSGEKYSYTVRAVAGASVSNYQKNGVSTNYIEAPSVHTIKTDSNSITVLWDVITAATSYQVYRRGVGQKWSYLKTVTKKYYVDNDVASGTKYNYAVRAVCGNSLSEYGTGFFVTYSGNAGSYHSSEKPNASGISGTPGTSPTFMRGNQTKPTYKPTSDPISYFSLPSYVKLGKDGIPTSYKNVISADSTAYSLPGRLTSTGKVAQNGYVAVDPKEIPYGTEMYIVSADGKYVYGYCIAADTGGYINSVDWTVDLHMSTRSDCMQWGRRDILIYIL